MRRSAFETMMMAKKSGKIKTFVEEGLDGLTEAVVDEFEEFLWLIATYHTADQMNRR